MKKLLKNIVIIFLCLFVIGCESKEMKDAKDFISLEDWENAVEKLNLEIKNKPKNIEAYKLLLVANKELYFGGSDISDFYNPKKLNDELISKLKFERGDVILKVINRMEKIDPNSIGSETYFLVALIYYFKWYSLYDSIIEKELAKEEQDYIEIEKLKRKLLKERCDNESIINSIEFFNKCTDIDSTIADNSFFWMVSMQCSESYDGKVFVDEFRKKYPDSDLIDEIDIVELIINLWNAAEKCKEMPNADNANNAMSIWYEYKKNHSNSSSLEYLLIYALVEYIAYNNREYSLEDSGYRYENADGLIDYYNALIESDTNTKFKFESMKELSRIYKFKKNEDLEMETYKKIISINFDGETNDMYHGNIAEIFEERKDYESAAFHYNEIKDKSDYDKLGLYYCYEELGKNKEAKALRRELDRSSNKTIELVLKSHDRLKLYIQELDAEFETHSINVKGQVVNTLPYTIRNVVVRARVSDKDGNNTKEGHEIIDVIYEGKKSGFNISLFYGKNRPDNILFNAHITSIKKY